MVEIHPLDRPSTRKDISLLVNDVLFKNLFDILIIYLILFLANREIERVAHKIKCMTYLSTRKDFPVGLMQYKDLSLLVNNVLILNCQPC